MKQQEISFQNLFETYPIPTIIYHPDGRVAAVNRAAERQLSLSGERFSSDYHLLDDQRAIINEHVHAFRRALAGETVTLEPIAQRFPPQYTLPPIPDPVSIPPTDLGKIPWTTSTFYPLSPADTDEESFSNDPLHIRPHVRPHIVEMCRPICAHYEGNQRAETLLSILNHMPILIDAFDTNGNIVVWNKECERVTGYTAEEVVNNPDALSFLYPNVHERQSLSFLWENPGHTYRNQERTVTCKDGTTRTIAWSRISGNFAIGGWVAWGIGVDITERKQLEAELEDRVRERTEMLQHAVQRGLIEIRERQKTEKALQASEQKFRCFFEQSRDGLALLDERGVVCEWNQGAEELFGLLRNHVVGRFRWDAFFRVLPDEQKSLDIYRKMRQQTHMTIKELKTNPTLKNGTQKIQRPDGTIRIIQSLVFPVKIGKRDYVGSTIRDVTEQTRIQQALRKSEERFRLFIENARDVMFRYRYVNPRGFEYISPSVTKMMGYTPEEYYNDPDLGFKVVHPDDRQTMLEFQQHLRYNSGSLEVRHLRKDGREIWIEHRSWPMLDEQGSPIAAEGIAIDITERKETERALEQARQAAEEATRAKSEFLATMSHEIRTPMNAVIGMTNLLLDTPLTDEQQDYVETIRMSGDALLTLINDILDFSKIEAGRMSLENTPFNLHNCIEEAIDLIASRAAEKGLDMTYMISSGTPIHLVSDASRLRQILVNLLSNAVKFTDKGEIVVSATSTPHTTTEHIIHISVRDTGIGIDPKSVHTLFRSFQQVDNSISRKYGGTGLGLAISKRLAEMMGGTMWVESVPNEGSTFHLTLVAETMVDVPSDAPPDVSPSTPSHPDLYHKCILVVRDSHTISHLVLTQRLQAWRMKVQLAHSFRDALNHIQHAATNHSPFDLILLNIYHSPSDWQEMVSAVRRAACTPDIPIIGVTTLKELNERKQDMDEYPKVRLLPRPLRQSQLYNTFVDLLISSPTSTTTAPRPHKQTLQAIAQAVPMRILLAEDNIVNQKIALRLLERFGYRADVAANGIEVIDAITHRSYDLILMDVQMPEMDGIQTTQHIRQSIPPNQQPYIIAMTAHALEGDREWCLNAGMDDYIGKPIHVERLVNALQRIQEQIQSSHRSPTQHERGP